MSDQKKTTDDVKAGGQEANDRLEKAPDANAVRNATGHDKQTAFDSNTNIWHSEQGMFAITDGSETITKRNAHAEKDQSPQVRTGDERFLSATLMALEAAKNPAMQPVALARQYADGLPDGHPQKQALTDLTREQAAALSPEMRERYEPFKGGTHEAITTESLTNTPEGWLSVPQKIAQLPMDKELEVIGSGLNVGIKQYQHDERERAWGQLIGTVQGTGEVLQGLAKIADFGAACILGDSERAGKMGEEFGAAVGQTIVGGVRLFQAADQYLYNIGYTGDYAKPFRDVTAAGQKLDEKWSHLPPLEQERVKARLITELLAGGAIGAGGVGALQKASKFTDILETIAIEAKALHAAAKPKIKQAVQAINNAVDELVQPMCDTGMGVKMPIPKDPSKGETKMLMSKADDIGPKRPEGGRPREPVPEKFRASPEFIADVKHVLARLSQGERDFLAEHDVAIKPIRRVADKFPKETNLGACYDQSENTIYVAEEVLRLGKFVPNYDLEFGFRHEFGHAFNAKFDAFGAWISDDPGFIAAYRKDVEKLPHSVLDELELSTKSKSIVKARDEVFADLYAHSTGLHSNNPYSQKLRAAFPNCLRYLEEM